MGAQKIATNLRRQQIAVAALELVAAQGWQGLTVAAIAAKVGLVPSALYRHFQNKDQIIAAILALIRQRLLKNVRLALAETPDPVDRLHRLLHLHLRLLLDHPGIVQVVFSEEVMSGPPERQAQVYELVQTYLAAVADLIQQGQVQGVIRADLQPESAAVAFLGLLQPAVILWHLSRRSFAVQSAVTQAWQIFAAGLRANHLNPKGADHETPESV